jgi:hypothetical protein
MRLAGVAMFAWGKEQTRSRLHIQPRSAGYDGRPTIVRWRSARPCLALDFVSRVCAGSAFWADAQDAKNISLRAAEFIRDPEHYPGRALSRRRPHTMRDISHATSKIRRAFC